MGKFRKMREVVCIDTGKGLSCAKQNLPSQFNFFIIYKYTLLKIYL